MPAGPEIDDVPAEQAGVILVDTSVWIDHFNGYDSDEAAYLLLCVANASPLVIPGLVLTEILLGVRNESEAARVTRVMSAFDLAPEFERQDSSRLPKSTAPAGRVA